MLKLFFKLYSRPLDQEERINAEMKTEDNCANEGEGQTNISDHMTGSWRTVGVMFLNFS